MVNTNEKVEFLKKIHLFFGASEEQILSVAGQLVDRQFDVETEVYSQGSPANEFCLIFSGSVRLFRQKKEETEELAKLEPGDYFGAEELLANKPRPASAFARPKTILLVISREIIEHLLKYMPRLKYSLQVDVRSQRLSRRLNFDWIEEDEFIYFLARRHWVILLKWLIGPALALFLTGFLLLWGLLTKAAFPAYTGGILFWPVIAWAIWNAIDWSNDYYVVTNKRVVWLEKVIGLYDSRQEAPLSTLLAVGVETDLIGRMLDYGTVVVRTFVGRIEFKHVITPYEAAHLITEQWDRSKEESSQAEQQTMEGVLRARLGHTTEGKPEEAPKTPVLKVPPRSIGLSLIKLFGGNLFKIRLEDSGTITYRKHWFVLVKQIWQPTLFLGIVLVWSLFRILDLLASGTFLQHTLDNRTIPDTILISQVFILFLLLLWWIYQYWDWRNDIFQVTPDQILDIDKKPFGTEERRAAPLDNILSTQYSRIGLAGYIFNFGTVYITVGGAQLAFEDVSDPASVQADIDRRRIASLNRKKEAEARRERERMADWLAAYRDNLDAFERGREINGEENKIE